MTVEQVRKSRLPGPGVEFFDASGSFYFPGAIYNVGFQERIGLMSFLDLYLNEGRDDTMARMYLTMNRAAVKWPAVNLRFQFNREHQVAAAIVVLAAARGDSHYWMTRGGAGRGDVTLAHDTWDRDNTLFSPESFITVPQLREVVIQFVFDDVLPPPAVQWIPVGETKWF